jgi:hypothetical protein
VTVKRAQAAAQSLVTQGMALLNTDAVPDVPGKEQAVDVAKTAATSVQELADELLETSKQNRELLTGLIRTEVDRSAGRMGFVREEELAAVRRHIARLENQIADMRTAVAAPSVTEAQAKVEELVNDGSVDDSKDEDVIAAVSELADAVSVEAQQAESSVDEAVEEVVAQVQDVVDDSAPVKRKIPYVKPGTENLEASQ